MSFRPWQKPGEKSNAKHWISPGVYPEALEGVEMTDSRSRTFYEFINDDGLLNAHDPGSSSTGMNAPKAHKNQRLSTPFPCPRCGPNGKGLHAILSTSPPPVGGARGGGRIFMVKSSTASLRGARRPSRGLPAYGRRAAVAIRLAMQVVLRPPSADRRIFAPGISGGAGVRNFIHKLRTSSMRATHRGAFKPRRGVV